jgi:hypothetical protein
MAGHSPTISPSGAVGNVTPFPVSSPAPASAPLPAARCPWHVAGISLTLGTPIGISLASHPIGLVMLAIATVAALAIAGTALYGSDRHSERAFRMLRWLASRPEPPARAASAPRPRHPGEASRAA